LGVSSEINIALMVSYVEQVSVSDGVGGLLRG